MSYLRHHLNAARTRRENATILDVLRCAPATVRTDIQATTNR
jgi:hypothetical protein